MKADTVEDLKQELAISEGHRITLSGVIETERAAWRHEFDQKLAAERKVCDLLVQVQQLTDDKTELSAMLERGMQLVDDSRQETSEALRARVAALEAGIEAEARRTTTELADLQTTLELETMNRSAAEREWLKVQTERDQALHQLEQAHKLLQAARPLLLCSPQAEHDFMARLEAFQPTVTEPKPTVVWGHASDALTERWSGIFDTMEAAIQDGLTEYADQDEFWICSGTRPDPAAFMPDEDWLIDQMIQIAGDNAGDVAEDWPDVSDDAREKLTQLLANWARLNCPVNFWISNGSPMRITRDEEVAIAASTTERVTSEAAAPPDPTGDSELKPLDREELGKLVRTVWIEWAKEQPNPKPSWLHTWEELTEPEREVDRRIGEALAVEVTEHSAGMLSAVAEKLCREDDSRAVLFEAPAFLRAAKVLLSQIRTEKPAVENLSDPLEHGLYD